MIKLSEDTLYGISWWKNNIFKAFKPIRYTKISIIIHINASLEGLSASIDNVSTGGVCLPRSSENDAYSCPWTEGNITSPKVICENKT